MPKFYAFRCSDTTYDECIKKNLFGQTKVFLNQIMQINKGDVIFLHKVRRKNDSEEFIEGPFFATQPGENLDKDAWNGKFPAQLRVEKRGNTKKILISSISAAGLLHAHDGVFFEFVIPSPIGWKLLDALGYSNDTIGEGVVENSGPNKEDFDFRLRYPAEIRCEDGHYVRSRAEAMVDNYLYNHGIVHAYERKIPGEKMLSDFYLKNKNGDEFYIEIWGLEDDQKYLSRKKEKIEIYKKKGLNLFEITNAQIKSIDDILSDILEKIKPT